MEKTKSETFVGFVLRARKYKIGGNAVATLKKANLIIVCDTASDNMKSEGLNFSARFRCPLLIAKERTLASLTGRENAKIMAVTDGALATAILNCEDTVFIKGN